ncbi:MAG: hypothetical protein AMXMBFR7_02570 [Planctomycetota bacterium]
MPTTDLMIQELVKLRHDPKGVSPTAFWQLVERFRADLVNQALAVLGSLSDAEDVAQESLCQAFQSLSELRDPEKLGHWMRAINRRNAIRAARRRRLQSQREGRLPTDAQPAIAPAAAGSRAPLERLARTIDGLPEENRTVVVLRFWEGRTYDEIAQILGVPVGTVNSRMARAYRLLARVLPPPVASPPAPYRAACAAGAEPVRAASARLERGAAP